MRNTHHLLLLLALLGLALACKSTGNPSPAPAPERQSAARGPAAARPATPENSGARPAVPTATSEPAYTAYNLWFEKAGNFYSTNYHVGRIIPAGSQVKDVSFSKTMITFTVLPEGVAYKMEFVPKHHPGLSINQFMARLFTTKSLGQLTEGFSGMELAAVKSGVLQPGMSKKAVAVAYGYPIETKTPSLQDNQWVFMMNRFRTKAINFDAQGRTTREAVPDAGSL